MAERRVWPQGIGVGLMGVALIRALLLVVLGTGHTFFHTWPFPLVLFVAGALLCWTSRRS